MSFHSSIVSVSENSIPSSVHSFFLSFLSDGVLLADERKFKPTIKYKIGRFEVVMKIISNGKEQKNNFFVHKRLLICYTMGICM